MNHPLRGVYRQDVSSSFLSRPIHIIFSKFVSPDTVFLLISARSQLSVTLRKCRIQALHFWLQHWNKRLLLISAAAVSTALIKIVTIFYKKLNQNACGTSIQIIKHWKYCRHFHYIWFIDSENLYFILILKEKDFDI